MPEATPAPAAQPPAAPPAATATPPAATAQPPATPPATPPAPLLDGAPPAVAAPPADIDIKFPDGFKANDEAMGEFKSIAKEFGLDSAKAQKVADLYVKSQQAYGKQLEAEAQSMHEDWKKQAAADKEFGGADFQKNTALANQAYKKFAPEDLQQVLKAYNLASHPAVVRLFYRLGKADAEPGAIPHGQPGTDMSEAAKYARQYPNTTFKQG